MGFYGMYKNLIIVFFSMIVLFNNLIAQKVDSKYEIATWQGFKKCAVSYTFDDNTQNQIDVMMPIFDRYNYKMTFFIVSSWEANWDILKSAEKNGHEIASHTVNHPNLSELDEIEQLTEFKNSKISIESVVGLNTCNTIAYPYCVEGNLDNCKKYYLAARICSGEIVPKSPENFMMISSFACGSEHSIQKSEDFIEIADSAVKENGWAVFLLHAIDEEDGYSPISSSELESTLKHMKKYNKEYWVASFGTVAKYIKERDNTTIIGETISEDIISFELSSDLDSEIYNEPLTIKRELPDSWESVEVKQNSKNLPSKIIDGEKYRNIVFNVAPNKGVIEIINNN